MNKLDILTDEQIAEACDLAEIQYFNWSSQDKATRVKEPPSSRRNIAEAQAKLSMAQAGDMLGISESELGFVEISNHVPYEQWKQLAGETND